MDIISNYFGIKYEFIDARLSDLETIPIIAARCDNKIDFENALDCAGIDFIFAYNED